jgi:protein-S-isoprenylcysteine O-methyltransferase Ste14
MAPTSVSEEVFGATTLILLVAFAAVWGTNLIRTRSAAGIFYSKQESRLMAATTRTLIAASLAAAVNYIVAPHSMRWSYVSLPGWVRTAGAALAACGVAMLAWVFITLGRNFSMSLVVRRDHVLVTGGPYRWIRHPMYTGFSMFFGGLCLASASWLVGVTAALGFGTVMIVRTPQEERMLRDRFGEEYEAYRRRTGRFLPR